jgi:hypothetical protein
MRAATAAANGNKKERYDATMDTQCARSAVQCDTGGGSAAAPHPRYPQSGEIPQIVACDNDGLLGGHIHIFGDTPDLGKWGNSISSMVILVGRWEFFDEEKFQGTKVELGPGVYLHVKDHGLKDNSISSIRLVSPRGR